eukprot:gene26502-33088_t
MVEQRKEKIRKFSESIELQIALKNCDPSRDKRFSGSFRLPASPATALLLESQFGWKSVPRMSGVEHGSASPPPPKGLDHYRANNKAKMQTITAQLLPLHHSGSARGSNACCSGQCAKHSKDSENTKVTENYLQVARHSTRLRSVGQKVHEYASTESGSEEGMEFSDNNVFRSKFISLRSQLKQALVVIGEQDRLIHEALLGKLHNMIDMSSGAALPPSDADEQEDHAISSYHDMDTSVTDEIVMFKDSDFLPPASPATALLLESQFGWKSVPRMSSVESGSSAVNASPPRNKAKIQTITAQYRSITLAQQEVAMRASAQSAPSTPKTPAVLASEKSELTETYLQGTPSAVARYVSTTPSTAARKYLKAPGSERLSTSSFTSVLTFLADSVEGIQFSDNNVFRSKFLSLRSQLKQALVVIGEQDRLIHEALLDKLHNMIDISNGTSVQHLEAAEHEDHTATSRCNMDASTDDVVMFKNQNELFLRFILRVVGF